MIVAVTEMTVRRICTVLPKYNYRFANEAQLHDRIASVLTAEGMHFEREVAIDKDRYDFLCDGGVVIEVKVDGAITDAIRQVDRYCEREDVRAAVIVSARSWRALPSTNSLVLRGRPVHLIHLSRQAF